MLRPKGPAQNRNQFGRETGRHHTGLATVTEQSDSTNQAERTNKGFRPKKRNQGNHKKVGRTAKSYDYGKEGKLLQIEADSHNYKREVRQKNHHNSIIAQRPFRQEAGEQSTKQQEYLNGPKATTGEMPTTPHTPTTTRSQSPLSRTPPPQTPLPPHSPPPPPPRSPLGTPGKSPPPAHQTSPARSRHSPNCL